jgi:hypothetical protein
LGVILIFKEKNKKKSHLHPEFAVAEAKRMNKKAKKKPIELFFLFET